MLKFRMLHLLMVATMSFAVISSNASFAEKPIVHTQSGDISGVRSASGIVAIKGIPFAEPPVGDLRWKPPVPVKHWSGVRSRDNFGASCMQRIHDTFLPWTPEFLTHNRVSEDCLYLNVWTPRVSTQANLPVIVFIHGGAFLEGAGDIAVYDGEHLAATGLVIVTINYRLGVFGFLAHPELSAESAHHSSGNYGLLDQIAALHWVQENIRSFGGDPHRVTIWGQSAGAFSVNALLASPRAKGLFQGAMADSGIGKADHSMADLKSAEAKGLAFAAEHHAASLKDLRAVPAEQLLPGSGFSLDVDGWVLPDTPAALSTKGVDNDVPVVTGYQANDGLLSMPADVTMDGFDKLLRKQYGDHADEFEKLYPAKNMDEARRVLLESSRDRNRVSMFLWASERERNHRGPVFTYFFTRAIPWPQHPEYGAFHTGELPYFFRNLDKLDRPWEPIDEDLSKTVSSYLKNFASTGNPNGSGLPNWPQVHSGQLTTMELGEKAGPISLADPARLNFWLQFFHSLDAGRAPAF
ncbi:carboxylesterase/lipase family protein [Silvibacterium acidisoli]|uniref:carboxylesterase/lipase family protein n=1 Tax=Acidobacteriaceae bacterium ZG23-2 TaxID=2883246 RepID=UPI00406C3D50